MQEKTVTLTLTDTVRHLCITAILLFLSGSGSSLAGSYMAMPLEDLMNLTVTSISRRDQPLQETAAAVYVITGEDLRRTGATSIPEALRMVPGFMVGQHDATVQIGRASCRERV